MKNNFIERLLSDREGQKLYFREDLIFEVTEAICRVMEEKGISKADLAKATGVSKSNITQLLSGDQNMRLTTVADLLFALDSRLEVTAAPAEIELSGVLGGIRSTVQADWTPAGDLTAGAAGYETLLQDPIPELLAPAA